MNPGSLKIPRKAAIGISTKQKSPKANTAQTSPLRHGAHKNKFLRLDDLSADGSNRSEENGKNKLAHHNQFDVDQNKSALRDNNDLGSPPDTPAQLDIANDTKRSVPDSLAYRKPKILKQSTSKTALDIH